MWKQLKWNLKLNKEKRKEERCESQDDVDDSSTLREIYFYATKRTDLTQKSYHSTHFSLCTAHFLSESVTSVCGTKTVWEPKAPRHSKNAECRNPKINFSLPGSAAGKAGNTCSLRGSCHPLSYRKTPIFDSTQWLEYVLPMLPTAYSWVAGFQAKNCTKHFIKLRLTGNYKQK